MPRPTLPVLALPAPETGNDAAMSTDRFDGLIQRAVAEAGARLVFRIPARPGSGYLEIAALARRSESASLVTLLTLGEDGATVAVAPADPDLAVFDGLARSFTRVMDHWTPN